MKIAQTIACVHHYFSQIPQSLIALLGRFSIAAVFWRSGQTKVEGFALDIFQGTVNIGWPALSDNAVFLFKEEYQLPLIAPELGATLAAFAEHFFPILILFGLATRLSAFALLVMTAVIQVLVYPGAYPTHGVWAAVLLYLMATGSGVVSLDHLLKRRCAARAPR
ncbi:MAG: DoxX family protein [Pusillimonas sp.]|jgi:putative oxidoreductase|nr:DoxX family protein [Pusillimonas sp.]